MYLSKKYKVAKVNFKYVLKANAYDIDSRYNLAMCYLRLNKTIDAIKNFEKCEKLGDKDAIEQLLKHKQ